MNPCLRIEPRGGTANQLLQFFFAANIQRLCENLEVTGYDVPEWGLISKKMDGKPKQELVLKGNYLFCDDIVKIIKRKLSKNIVLKGQAFRLSNYAQPEFYRPLIKSNIRTVPVYGEGHVVFHIRGGDILQPAHRDYYPIPFSYIDAVLKKSDALPVFLGQMGESYYTEKLRQRYPEAVFSPPKTAIEDFETLRHSRQIAVSISSFSWTAAWLSHAKTIHLPVAGFLHPIQRPDIDLLPVNDARYKFYQFEPFKWNATQSDINSLWQEREHVVWDTKALLDLKKIANEKIKINAQFARTKLHAQAYLRATADKFFL
ncbi:hypothetical protein [Rhizobium sp. Leaf262]|uniref:hypothetical protein n=1 Tax=Rhizobium sp. Leaf262 TaxID=1736312 RepID=UPI000714B108|nr:hypothetical protein [Rhizobium sp. Leaf262]KQO82234.1 hypothetical protein ASF29_16960 [Rhizobium sp. Leaf262]